MKRILELYTTYFAVWVLLGGVLAYVFPAPFLALKPYNKAFFGLTMFGIGAVLKPEDFARIARKPWIVAVGSAAQFTLMPLGAFAAARAFRLPPDMAVGLILAGCVPGAMASNVMSYIARADAAYSVSLTTVSTLLCPILTPLLTRFLAGTVLDVPFRPMMLDVLRMVAGPLAVGLLLRRLLRKHIEPVVHVFPAVSVTFIVFICALVVAGNRAFFSAWSLTLALVIGAVFALNVYGMLTGYGVGRLARFSLPRRRTLSIEIGMQNAGMGTVLALAHFGERAAVSTAVFVYMCIITASAMAELWRRRPADNAPPPDGTEVATP
ncbi:MAG: bile acid:sodium symporter family protein [Lentisphaerae bacterium]|nr:bile acid:sodium symporter family protein [Lentisphaerota bacterium]